MLVVVDAVVCEERICMDALLYLAGFLLVIVVEALCAQALLLVVFWVLFGCSSGCGSIFFNMVVAPKPIDCSITNHRL